MNRYWKIVHRIFEDGRKCDDCPHLRTWTEHHGPGLDEPMAECAVINSGTDPTDCPGTVGAEVFEE